jgi:threonyl-tRNA synthetase
MITPGQDITIEKVRHSAAHIVAQAVLRIHSDAKLGIGPATEDGFYYDIEIESIVDQTRFLKQLYSDKATILRNHRYH